MIKILLLLTTLFYSNLLFAGDVAYLFQVYDSSVTGQVSNIISKGIKEHNQPLLITEYISVPVTGYHLLRISPASQEEEDFLDTFIFQGRIRKLKKIEIINENNIIRTELTEYDPGWEKELYGDNKFTLPGNP